jgi:hypothetical protein
LVCNMLILLCVFFISITFSFFYITWVKIEID